MGRLVVLFALVLGAVGFGIGSAVALQPLGEGNQNCTDQSIAACAPYDVPVPSAHLDADCYGFHATMSNTGTAPAEFTVSGSNGQSDSVTVLPDDSVTEVYPVTEDVAVTVTISSGGKVVASKTYAANCQEDPPAYEVPEPAATVTADCYGFHATMSNTGTAPAEFTVTGSNGGSDSVTVAPGDSVTEVYPVTEDVEETLSVSSDGEVLASETYTADCEANPPARVPNPTAAVGADCDGFVVTLVNTDRPEATTFQVTGPDGRVHDVRVAAGEMATRTYPVTEDVRKTVNVSWEGETLASLRYRADCETPSSPGTDEPPVDQPPADQPPADQPPADRPPVKLAPPVDQPVPPTKILPQTGAGTPAWLGLLGAALAVAGGGLLTLRRKA